MSKKIFVGISAWIPEAIFWLIFGATLGISSRISVRCLQIFLEELQKTQWKNFWRNSCRNTFEFRDRNVDKGISKAIYAGFSERIPEGTFEQILILIEYQEEFAWEKPGDITQKIRNPENVYRDYFSELLLEDFLKLFLEQFVDVFLKEFLGKCLDKILKISSETTNDVFSNEFL